MTNALVKTVDLSIDFDFFVRELLEWDWGHGETAGHFYATALWNIRYSGNSFDIYDETDPAKHADVEPNAHFISALTDKGLSLGLYRDKKRKIGVAESHKEAFEFFTNKSAPADYVVNIDAHHDVYTTTENPLDCGNWLSHLHQKWPETKIVQVYPKWQSLRSQMDAVAAKGGDTTISGVPLRIARWADFKFPEGAILRNVFICRSGAWTPPHLDQMFFRFCRVFGLLSTRQMKLLDQMIVRDEYVIPHAEHLEHVAEQRERMEKIRQMNIKALENAGG
jgi:hypothetical protein